MLNSGDQAPDFVLPRDGGGEVSLSAMRPAKVVVFFYPKDDTPGCTKEAIGFTEHLNAFKARQLAGCHVHNHKTVVVNIGPVYLALTNHFARRRLYLRADLILVVNTEDADENRGCNRCNCSPHHRPTRC